MIETMVKRRLVDQNETYQQDPVPMDAFQQAKEMIVSRLLHNVCRGDYYICRGNTLQLCLVGSVKRED